jgi:hypothetical protein
MTLSFVFGGRDDEGQGGVAALCFSMTYSIDGAARRMLACVRFV